jgi:pilus assembly protein CpaF
VLSLASLMLDDISEIMGNPDSSWWFERDGILHSAADVSFSSEGLRTGLEVVANKLGKKLDEENPVLNAQLPDGSRLAAVIPTVVRPDPAMVIRNSSSRRFTIQDLIERGTLTTELANHLAHRIADGKTDSNQRRNRYREDHFAKHSGTSDSEHKTNCSHRGHRRASIRKANILAAECQTDTHKLPLTWTCSEAPLDGGLTESSAKRFCSRIGVYCRNRIGVSGVEVAEVCVRQGSGLPGVSEVRACSFRHV